MLFYGFCGLILSFLLRKATTLSFMKSIFLAIFAHRHPYIESTTILSDIAIALAILGSLDMDLK